MKNEANSLDSLDTKLYKMVSLSQRICYEIFIS